MLFELAYPALCLMDSVRRMCEPWLGRPAPAFGGDPQPARFRHLRSRLRRLDIRLMTTILPFAGGMLALRRFECDRAPIPAVDLPIDHHVRTAKGTLAVRLCGNPNGSRALLLHGWGADGTMVWPLTRLLADAGFEVVVPDLPGDGASQSAALSFHEKGRLIAAHCGAFGPFDCVIGHSAGGLIAAIALDAGLKADKIITVCTPQSLGSLLHSYLVQTAAPRRLMDAIFGVYRFVYRVDPRHVGPRTFARMGNRLLVVHATADWQVAAEEAHAILAIAPDAGVLFLDDCNHRTVLSHPALTRAIVCFADNRQARAEANHVDAA